MANTGFKGIDIRQSGNKLIIDVGLDDITGEPASSGTTTVSLYEIQDDGTLKSYDFNDNTFKTGTLTTETLSLTHRTGNNSTTNTGYWSAVLSTLSGFTIGAIYLMIFRNNGANPIIQRRKFQYGSSQGDTIKFAKNTAFNNFTFVMISATDHVTPITGRTVTSTRSIDGAAAASTTNSVTEIANGRYKIDLSASDMNGDVVNLLFTATGADPLPITIITQQ